MLPPVVRGPWCRSDRVGPRPSVAHKDGKTNIFVLIARAFAQLGPETLRLHLADPSPLPGCPRRSSGIASMLFWLLESLLSSTPFPQPEGPWPPTDAVPTRGGAVGGSNAAPRRGPGPDVRHGGRGTDRPPRLLLRRPENPSAAARRQAGRGRQLHRRKPGVTFARYNLDGSLDPTFGTGRPGPPASVSPLRRVGRGRPAGRQTACRRPDVVERLRPATAQRRRHRRRHVRHGRRDRDRLRRHRGPARRPRDPARQ